MTGATVYAANKASNAAKQAAAQQTDAGNRALDLQRQMYEQQRADEAPYRQMGYGALNTLSSMMGGMGGATPMGGPSSRPTLQKQGAIAGGGVSLSNLGGGRVMMAAPNGQRQMVPADQVAHYQALGAQVVS